MDYGRSTDISDSHSRFTSHSRNRQPITPGEDAYQPSYTLRTAMEPFPDTSRCQPCGTLDTGVLPFISRTRQSFGVTSDSLPHIDLVSPAIRQNIIDGKYVNLSLLLMPDSDSAADYRFTETTEGRIELKRHSATTSDKRAQRSLTLPEFIAAFATYKNVMCEVYPIRRAELDAYQRDIVEMAMRYGGTLFYDYHKSFALRAATYLTNENIKIDWSVRDSKLFASIFSGSKVNACGICGSVMHLTHFCPSAANTVSQRNLKAPGYTSNAKPDLSRARWDSTRRDIQGRPRLMHNGREVCNNFNTDKGCRRPSCDFEHVCIKCRGPHGEPKCNISSIGLPASNKIEGSQSKPSPQTGHTNPAKSK